MATTEKSAAFIIGALCHATGQPLLEAYDRAQPRGAYRDLIAKAGAVDTTTGEGLLSARFGAAFMERMIRASVLVRAGAVELPVRVPFVPVDDDTAADFIAEGTPIPVADIAFDEAFTLAPMKLAVIGAVTRELARLSGPRGVAAVERVLSRIIARGLDVRLLDADARVFGERPAGLLSGLTPIAVGSPVDLEATVAALVEALSGGDPAHPAFITSTAGALVLVQARTSSGQRLFPDASIIGGTLLGAPLLVSPGANNNLVALDAARLVYGLGPALLEASHDADLAFPGEAGAVSGWQNNLIALRAMLYVDWRLTASDAAAFAELGA